MKTNSEMRSIQLMTSLRSLCTFAAEAGTSSLAMAMALIITTAKMDRSKTSIRARRRHAARSPRSLRGSDAMTGVSAASPAGAAAPSLAGATCIALWMSCYEPPACERRPRSGPRCPSPTAIPAYQQLAGNYNAHAGCVPEKAARARRTARQPHERRSPVRSLHRHPRTAPTKPPADSPSAPQPPAAAPTDDASRTPRAAPRLR
mmetsp:Transcript_7919/g.28133  ORF Transcript_7919/g.28133 Transcript_7919/m.28133 type:complete len:204 (+) Transcript_7919:6365-6976(+)